MFSLPRGIFDSGLRSLFGPSLNFDADRAISRPNGTGQLPTARICTIRRRRASGKLVELSSWHLDSASPYVHRGLIYSVAMAMPHRRFHFGSNHRATMKRKINRSQVGEETAKFSDIAEGMEYMANGRISSDNSVLPAKRKISFRKLWNSYGHERNRRDIMEAKLDHAYGFRWNSEFQVNRK